MSQYLDDIADPNLKIFMGIQSYSPILTTENPTK